MALQFPLDSCQDYLLVVIGVTHVACCIFQNILLSRYKNHQACHPSVYVSLCITCPKENRDENYW